jgi:hypothetical protein
VVRRFGDAVDADATTRIAAASIAQLDRWMERVLSAATLAELRADE